MKKSLNKKYRKITFVLIIISALVLLFTISAGSGKRIRIFFSSGCVTVKQAAFSKRLNDRLVDYDDEARASGIKECRDENEIREMVISGKLKRISSNRYYSIDKLQHSYPFLTPGGRKLLKEIGRRFREKTKKEGYMGVRFVVTSLTRTGETINSLKKNNSNVSVKSPHLYGNAFDISYTRFSYVKLFHNQCDVRFFKEALAEVIYELRKEGKCRAVYERNQSCFHVVAL